VTGSFIATKYAVPTYYGYHPIRIALLERAQNLPPGGNCMNTRSAPLFCTFQRF
jgi:hypothetical protein